MQKSHNFLKSFGQDFSQIPQLYQVFLVVLLFGSCAQTRFVEPLDKGQLSVGGNFGGPLIAFDPLIIPIPLLAAEVGYGIDTNFTIHGGLNLTSLYFNNLHLDAGITFKFVEQKKFIPNISVTPSFNFVYDLNDHIAKFWPVLDLNAYWNYGKRKNYFYAGFNNYFELSKTMANDQPQAHHWLFSPQIGHIIKSKNQFFQFTTEIKFLGINLDNTTAFIPYKSFTGPVGATGIYLGFRWFINRN